MNDAINDLGAVTTVGLAAGTLDGPAGPVEGDHPEQCANCRAHLDGPFCHLCGQHGKDQFTDLRTGWKRLDAGIEEANENPHLLVYKLKMSAYKFAWALIPISLPFIWLLFAFRRDVTLYDHAVFATYSISFVSLLLVALSVFGALGASGNWMSLVFFVGVPLHLYKQLKGTYALGRVGALWRTATLLVFASIAVLLFGCLILAIDLLV